jgi:hypothetical protein
MSVFEGFRLAADMAFKEVGCPDIISEASPRELCNRCVEV